MTDPDDHSYEDVEHSMYGTDLEDDPDDWIPGVNRTDAEWRAWLAGTTEPAEGWPTHCDLCSTKLVHVGPEPNRWACQPCGRIMSFPGEVQHANETAQRLAETIAIRDDEIVALKGELAAARGLAVGSRDEGYFGAATEQLYALLLAGTTEPAAADEGVSR